MRAFCPNAATDRREHDPFVLAKRMGLNVERLPLYGRPHTLSMLFFCPETVMVQNSRPHQRTILPLRIL